MFAQQGAVGKEINLPAALIGADIGVFPNVPQDVHGNQLVFTVLHGDNVRMDILLYFPAGEAGAAGAAFCGTGALMSGGGKAGGGEAVACSGEEKSVGEGSAGGGGTDTGEDWLKGHSGAPFALFQEGREFLYNYYTTGLGKKKIKFFGMMGEGSLRTKEGVPSSRGDWVFPRRGTVVFFFE